MSANPECKAVLYGEEGYGEKGYGEAGKATATGAVETEAAADTPVGETPATNVALAPYGEPVVTQEGGAIEPQLEYDRGYKAGYDKAYKSAYDQAYLFTKQQMRIEEQKKMEAEIPEEPEEYGEDYGEKGYGEEGYGEKGYGEKGYGEKGYGEKGYGEEEYGEDSAPPVETEADAEQSGGGHAPATPPPHAPILVSGPPSILRKAYGGYRRGRTFRQHASLLEKIKARTILAQG
jgi:hypothetical protein